MPGQVALGNELKKLKKKLCQVPDRGHSAKGGFNLPAQPAHTHRTHATAPTRARASAYAAAAARARARAAGCGGEREEDKLVGHLALFTGHQPVVPLDRQQANGGRRSSSLSTSTQLGT